MIIKKLEFNAHNGGNPGTLTGTCQCICDYCGKTSFKNVHLDSKKTFCEKECYLNYLEEIRNKKEMMKK